MENATLFKNPKIQTARRLQDIFGLPRKPVLKKLTGSQGLTYLMNKDTVVKIPLTDAQTKQLKALAAVLALLKHKTRIQTPDLKLHALLTAAEGSKAAPSMGERDGLGREAVIGSYPLLKGNVFPGMAEFYDEEAAVRENAVYELGAFVADLHSLTPDETKSLKIGTARDYLRTVLFEDFKHVTHDIPANKRLNFSEEIYGRIFDGCDSAVLCHMDLHMGNMCFDANKKLSGVFDFGSVIAAPKELEFMMISSIYDEELSAFKKGYRDKSQTAADFESPQFRRVSKYLSPFSRDRELPALIRKTKQKI